MLPGIAREDWRRLGNGGAVVSWLGRAEMHAGAVAHHRLPVPERAAARPDDAHVVAQALELVPHVLRDEGFDQHVAACERSLREAARLECLLDVEPEVGAAG